MSAAFNPVEKYAHIRISLDFFLIYTVGADNLLNSTFDNMIIFTNRSSYFFNSSVAVNGTFRFFLKLGRIFSFSSHFTLILVYLPRPVSSILIFFSFGRNAFYFLAKRFNLSIPETLNFLVIAFSDTGIIISPSNFILFPVTVLFVIFIIGLFNFLQVCKFIIDKFRARV